MLLLLFLFVCLFVFFFVFVFFFFFFVFGQKQAEKNLVQNNRGDFSFMNGFYIITGLIHAIAGSHLTAEDMRCNSIIKTF